MRHTSSSRRLVATVLQTIRGSIPMALDLEVVSNRRRKNSLKKSSRANKCESKDVHHDFDRVITKLTDDVEFVEEVCQHNSLNKKGAGRKLQGQADPQYRRTKGVGCPLSYR